MRETSKTSNNNAEWFENSKRHSLGQSPQCRSKPMRANVGMFETDYNQTNVRNVSSSCFESFAKQRFEARLKQSNATNLVKAKTLSRHNKPTNWLLLAIVIFVGTGLIIAISILLTPETPFTEQDETGTAPLKNLPTPSQLKLLFPPPDPDVSVERLKIELLAMAERLDLEFPSSVEGLHAAAMTFAEFKQTKRAEETWRKCIELKPKEVGPYVGMASVLSQRGEDEQAVALLRNASKSGQTSAELVAELAGGLSKLGELDQADAVLNEGVQSFPNSAEIMTQRGTIDMQLQRVESAERAFRKAIELGGESKAIEIMLANSLTRQGKTEEAKQLQISSASKAQDPTKPLSPGFEITYLKTLRGLAVRLFQIGSRAALANGKPLLAEQWLLRTISIEPTDLSTYMELSAVYRRSNRIPDALQVQEKLLELQPENVLNHINLASVASQLGNYALAERVLTQAIQISPDVAFPFAELAKIHLGNRELSKAKQRIATAAQLEPLNVEWHVMSAMVAEALGDVPGVIKSLKRATELSPGDQQIKILLLSAEAAAK